MKKINEKQMKELNRKLQQIVRECSELDIEVFIALDTQDDCIHYHVNASNNFIANVADSALMKLPVDLMSRVMETVLEIRMEE